MKIVAVLAFLVAAVDARRAANATLPTPTQASGVCKLQFTSPCDQSSECGDLNGFNLTCIKSGTNKQCGCNGGSANCQKNSTSAEIAYQFDECTSTRRCVSGSGFTALDANPSKTCEEPLYCVQEQNPDPVAILKSFCHTCGSCKTQNVKNEKDPNELRFDCSKICPTPAPTTVTPTDAPTEGPTRAPKTSAPTTTVAAPAAGGQSSANSLAIGALAIAVVAAQLA
ncbi:hypothetical protein AC1031_003449 [Aphanomyces cochlioides]|nr:hypothetical protein AC1031_003449 [Aphanomyces cochlioides]